MCEISDFSDAPSAAARQKPKSCLADAAPSGNDQAKIKAEEVLSHIPALRVYARSLCRDVTLADDLVQDTLLRAIGSIGQFRPGTNLRAWLFTILRNCFYTAYAKMRREATGSEDCVSDQPMGLVDAPIWSITRKETERALARMPSQYSEALILVAVLGTSYADAAELLNCDIGTVKSRISRARARLREEMGHVFQH